MKRIRRAYSKTVSLIDETAVQIYESFVGKRKGFLLESYDKNNGRYVFMGKDPEEVITSKENGLLIARADGITKDLNGNPVDLLKEYYSDFEIHKDDEQLAFTGGLVGGLVSRQKIDEVLDSGFDAVQMARALLNEPGLDRKSVV